MYNLTEQELKALSKALEEAGQQSDIETLEREYKTDYLSLNRGRDGKKYAWYFDGNNEAIIEVESLELVDNSKAEDLFE